MRIAPARVADESAIKSLLDSVELPTADITAQSLEHFQVLLDGERLVGVIGLDIEAEIALLRSLAVDLSVRGQGAGRDLLLAAERMAPERGVRSVYLLTTTADGFFASRGYRALDRSTAPAAIQRTSQFRILCPASSILMVKIL